MDSSVHDDCEICGQSRSTHDDGFCDFANRVKRTIKESAPVDPTILEEIGDKFCEARSRSRYWIGFSVGCATGWIVLIALFWLLVNL